MDPRAMDPKVLIAIVAVVALLVIAAVVLYNRRNSSARLKEKFGPEYDRVVRQQGDPRLAENVLVERERRVSALKLRETAIGICISGPSFKSSLWTIPEVR